MTKINIHCIFISIIILISMGYSAHPKNNIDNAPPTEYPAASGLGKIGEHGLPTNPMNDRAKGYLLKGKVKNAIMNYGNYIDWDNHPAGLWGNWTYLPTVGFIAGVPGHAYSSDFIWTDCSTDYLTEALHEELKLWCSEEAYDEWRPEVKDFFSDMIFEVDGDDGTLGDRVTLATISEINQWGFDKINEFIFISVSKIAVDIDPNNSNAMIGLVYPWAKRPELVQRLDAFDLYDYGDDEEEWTDDDSYVYYGANSLESWFSGYSDSYAADWQASYKSRENTHNTLVNAADIFGQTIFTDDFDTDPLLAHSDQKTTWPSRYNFETGKYEPFWPGWFAKDYYGEDVTQWVALGIENCNGTRKDQDCWLETADRPVSDSDVYLEFDDRWAHRGNQIENGQYRQKGYPLGLRVKSMAHSYGVAYAEDIMFVTVKVRNESGSWYDEDGTYHSAMVMPDGTQLNGGKGFDYRKLFLGFYMDADVVTADINGNYGFHSNADDFMEYYTEPYVVNEDTMRISMAYIYDYDFGSNQGIDDMGIVAVQLLDSPKATSEVDLNGDGIIDIHPGDKLKMTDWHWFDWYNRPGVVDRESNTDCCAGYTESRPQAKNKELIQYKVMSGDTTNLTNDEKEWFFHTEFPDTDSDIDIDPHFDSLDGLLDEQVFNQGEEGLDCVLEMSSGPFDLAVGEEVPFSFCIIFGENKVDLLKNARMAQVMYNSNYQGFTAPMVPRVQSEFDHGSITLKWGTSSIYSRDVVTGYSDFEGYKIYKSIDGGITWGNSEDKIYDTEGVHVGWQPIAQFDLTAIEDSLFCVKGLDLLNQIGPGKPYSTWEDCAFNAEDPKVCCKENTIRGTQISGSDPVSPWFLLGDNSGFSSIYNEDSGFYEFVDTLVTDGMEYTYAVTAYDMGVSGAVLNPNPNGTIDTLYIANPDKWAAPDGYSSIENSKGTTVFDSNFVTVIPGHKASDNLLNVKVVPNPYISHSDFNETKYLRKLRFTNLPEKCEITIYTISGEKVITLQHDNTDDGNEWWDLRTINNQEVAPGLYLFTVEDENTDKFIGKFAVIR